jgi:hypothetical protein
MYYAMLKIPHGMEKWGDPGLNLLVFLILFLISSFVLWIYFTCMKNEKTNKKGNAIFLVFNVLLYLASFYFLYRFINIIQ